MFDNAPCHRKFPDDGLNALAMNVRPGGKQPRMRGTVWNGQVQTMTLADGTPKGLKLVLQERGVNCKDLNAESMRGILSKHNDFVQQKTLLEERVEARGHTCICLFSEISL